MQDIKLNEIIYDRHCKMLRKIISKETFRIDSFFSNKLSPLLIGLYISSLTQIVLTDPQN